MADMVIAIHTRLYFFAGERAGPMKMVRSVLMDDALDTCLISLLSSDPPTYHEGENLLM